jgi:hypothetical protein
MNRPERNPAKAELRKSWARWTEVVELFARRRAGRKQVDPRTYATEHRELLEKCRALAASANDVDAAFYRYLEDLAQPWFEPATLARGDRDILYDLLLRCQHVETQLGGRSWLRWLRSPRAFVPAAALTFAIMLLWMGKSFVLLRAVFDAVRGWTDSLAYSITHSSDQTRLIVVACILIAVSMYTASRTAKS